MDDINDGDMFHLFKISIFNRFKYPYEDLVFYYTPERLCAKYYKFNPNEASIAFFFQ